MGAVTTGTAGTAAANMNIMELLEELDRRTREMWVCEDGTDDWKPIFDEVAAGPANQIASPDASPALLLAAQMDMVNSTMRTLVERLNKAHGIQRFYRAQAGIGDLRIGS